MSAQDNATTLGKPNQNLVLETAGRIYVKVQDRFYELDFRNQGRGGGDTKIEIVNNSSNNQDIDLKGYVTKEFLKASLNSYVTKRSWNDVKETQSMLENAMLDGFTESINPITVQTMQVIVGADQLQFEFVNNFTEANETTYGPNLYKNSIEFIEPSGGIYIKHYTLDGPTDVRPEDPNDQTQLNQLRMQYCRWRIAPNRFDLGDPSASYYIYIKVPRLINSSGWINSSDPMTIYTKTNAEGTNVYNQYGLGEFVLSNTAIEMTSESHYYYLLYGMINSDDGSGRSFSTMNGFTEILPGQITAYIFKSTSGDSYLDLRRNVLKLGDSFMWNIDKNGVIGDNILYIKGAIVVDHGENESPMQLNRGIFHRFRYKNGANDPYLEWDYCEKSGAYQVEGNVYYPGNVVTWTNEKGLTSSYIYIHEPEDPDTNEQPHAYFSCDYVSETIEEDSGYNSLTTYYDPTNENFWRVLAQGVRGYSNLIADLSNEMEAIACDKEGYVITENGLDVTTHAGLFYGSSDVELAIKPNTVDTPNITIDLSEIEALNPQPEDPNAPRNPTVTYTISNIQDDYQKLITFHIDHGALIPEKCEIPITLVSKDKFGDEQDDTRIIVFTLVGVRSGKAYALVPSARSVRRTPNGQYDPAIFECDVICNGSSENVNTSEVIVKRVFGNSIKINEGTAEEINISDIDAGFGNNLEAFINDHNYDWDWYEDSNDHTKDSITFGDETWYEKITLFLYYKDPLSLKWILCDKETILVIKDGDPGIDFSIAASSNLFMYETETSKLPNNSLITLTAVPNNIKRVDHYIWQYRNPEKSQNWNYIDPDPNSSVAFVPTQGHPEMEHWWKQDSENSQLSTISVKGPIDNNGVINYRDFDTYFERKINGDETSRYRECEFKVTIFYEELSAIKSVFDSTSIYIIKGGDGAITINMPNSNMLFSSKEKNGILTGFSEQTKIEVWYGLEQIHVKGVASSDVIAQDSLIDVDIVRYKYWYNSKDNSGADIVVESSDYIGSNKYSTAPAAKHIAESTGEIYENISNCVKAHWDIQEINNVNRLFIVVETGQNPGGTSFKGIRGEIDVEITIKFPDKLVESQTLIRTIYWYATQQGEPGAGKQMRGRSEWGGQYGYSDMENCRMRDTYPDVNHRMDYQGIEDEESNWISAFGHDWSDKGNIFFDIILYKASDNDKKTYYCKHGGAYALWGDPNSSYYVSHEGDYNYVLPPSSNSYAWEKFDHVNIASDVAFIHQALIDELKITKLYTPGIPGLHAPGNTYQYVNQLSVADNALSITNGRNEAIVNISSNNLPTTNDASGTINGTFGTSWDTCDSSGSQTTVLFSVSPLSNGKLSICSFSIDLNYSSLGNTILDSLDINGKVWLSTNSSGNTGVCIGSFSDFSITTNHTFDISGGLYNINTGNTYYLVLNMSYSIYNGIVPSYRVIADSYYSVIYPSINGDGTFIAGNGFQTQWTNTSQNITSTINVNGNTSGANLTIKSENCDIDVSGTVSLSGTVTSNNVNVLTSNDTPRIYIQQTILPTSSSPDGLYFIY